MVEASSLKKLELGTFSPEALLFQSGYLTIKEMELQDKRILYHLAFPNFAVQRSFNYGMAEHLTKQGEQVTVPGKGLLQALGENDFSAFRQKIRELLPNLPHAWHDSGKLGHHESWYASMLYMSFRTTTANLAVEEMTSQGRSDMVLLHENQVFVFEFKMVKG